MRPQHERARGGAPVSLPGKKREEAPVAAVLRVAVKAGMEVFTNG